MDASAPAPNDVTATSMAGNADLPRTTASGPYPSRLTSLRSFREQAPDSDASDSEARATAGEALPCPRPVRISSISRRRSLYDASPSALFAPSTADPSPDSSSLTFTPARSDSPYENWGSYSQSHRRRGSRTPTARDRTTFPNIPDPSTYEYELALALEHGILEEEFAPRYDNTQLPASAGPSRAEPHRLRAPRAIDALRQSADYSNTRAFRRSVRVAMQNDPLIGSSRSAYSVPGGVAGSAKRSRDRFEGADNSSNTSRAALNSAVAIMSYRSSEADPEANDIWPEFRDSAKLPARYALLNSIEPAEADRTKRRSSRVVNVKKSGNKRKAQPTDPGRPQWNLPVELVELIAEYLNRDDIKALRMVSHELNHNVSQVIFQTVVVPFNTEIYGMLAQGQKPDLKGKGKVRRDKRGYSWRNANGDEVYNGHGLDVFKGFGRHILKYGMSFEVSEESLSDPPVKSITEKKTSFWGSYDWPYDRYRRFDAVAGLETAADETPRMKIAFSELTKVKELALSVDSGLGWLTGPDRSIRARILRQPPSVFGASKTVPDRRAQAQQELWRHIEAIHQDEEEDVKLATLYRLDGTRPLSEVDEPRMLAQEQPEQPYLDQHLIHEAIPHDTGEVPVPTSFDDPEVLDRFVLCPASSGSGILFTSVHPPTEAGQIMSPVIPANLTKAQKEWLLETEWAQRAFLSSYMISIIDNPLTFTPISTLNISRLSDRYLTMLSRTDFWDALPNLKSLTIMVVPGWRNVYKDEAGFVDTPRINPMQCLGPFFDLLQSHVANRQGIRNLTIGWIGGGEHAEGLHARNKLIMPAPLVPTILNSHPNPVFMPEIITEMDAGRLSAALIRFPHVERLALKNCWMTPAALLQFVKIHDGLDLKNLVLDSVSLTAMLRPNGHGNQAAHAVGAPNPLLPAPPNPFLGPGAGANALNNNPGGQGGNQAQAQPLPNNNQLLAWLTQMLQVHTQNVQQMQQAQGNAGGIQQQTAVAALLQFIHTQTQHLHQVNQRHAQMQQQAQAHTNAQNQQAQNQQQARDQFQLQQEIASITHAVLGLTAQVQLMQQQLVVLAPTPPTYQPPANPQSLLHSQPREGSWASIIDIISPGPNLSDFGSEHSNADPERQTSLKSIEFISCGYAKLPYIAFDQADVDRGNRFATATYNPLLLKRYNTLTPAMMTARWAHLGEIVQDADPMEIAALDAGWSLKTGWDDVEAAVAVEFDGYLPGGTSRFTGTVRIEDRVGGDENGAANTGVLMGFAQLMRALGIDDE